MLQIVTDPKNTYLATSRQALAAIALAIGAFLGRVYHLFVDGPSSYASKLMLLAVALLAMSIATDELRQRDDEEQKPVVASVAQRIGFIQTCLGGALLIFALV